MRTRKKSPGRTSWTGNIRPTPTRRSGPAAVLRSGRSEHSIITEAMLVDGAHDPEYLELMRGLGLTSYMCVPLAVRDRTLGTITFVAASAGAAMARRISRSPRIWRGAPPWRSRMRCSTPRRSASEPRWRRRFRRCGRTKTGCCSRWTPAG